MANVISCFVDGSETAEAEEAQQPRDPLMQEHLKVDEVLRDTWFVGFSEIHDSFFTDDMTRRGISVSRHRYSLTNEINGGEHIRSAVSRTQRMCGNLLVGRALCFLSTDEDELYAGKHRFTERIGEHGEVLHLAESKREPLDEEDYAILDLISRAVERAIVTDSAREASAV